MTHNFLENRFRCRKVLFQVEAAVSQAQLSSLPELRFVGETLLVLKRTSSTEDLKVWEVSGGEQLRQMSKEVRFKTGMINDHMPWAYNKIFSGHTLIALHVSQCLFNQEIFPGLGSPDVAENISLEVIDTSDDQRLYPDLSGLN